MTLRYRPGGDEEARYVARLKGGISPHFARVHVLAIGVGAGGDMVIKLCRHCPGAITIIDNQRVELENCCRSPYSVESVGEYKVEALAGELRRACPFVEVTPVVADITTMDHASLTQLVAQADLVIAGTDNFQAQALINAMACQTGTPAVFIGVHEGARGGLVEFVLPGETPCYRCLAPKRYASADDAAAHVDLHASRGTMADVAFIDAIALKIVLGLLERSQDSEAGRFLLGLGQRTQVVVRAHPAYRWGEVDPFGTVLDALPSDPVKWRAVLEAQAYFALDTLWLASERNPDCPDCGHLFVGGNHA